MPESSMGMPLGQSCHGIAIPIQLKYACRLKNESKTTCNKIRKTRT